MQERFTSKNLTILRKPAAGIPGLGEFQFTDDYSIFHLGKMPDRIPAKGEAGCRIAVANLQALEAEGIPTHFHRAVGKDRMEFQLLRILNPADKPIQRGEHAYFVPLQVIFRNSLPQGASVFQRLAQGEVSLQSLGLKSLPEPGVRLSHPLIEYMSKLDEIDEFISRSAAQELAGLTDIQMNRLDELVRQVNEVISNKARAVDLYLADGKLEFGVDQNGDLLLVDIVGTPDESRFLLKEQHISKQVLRDCYENTQLREQVKRWAARGRPAAERPMPSSLGTREISIVSEMYKSLCERWLGASVWGAADLETVTEALQQLKTVGGTDIK